MVKLRDRNDKMKITISLLKELKQLNGEIGEMNSQIDNIDERKYDTTEKFSLRNVIFQMERNLKSEIQQRTGLLARAQQTELFNIREVLRTERKNLTKVSEKADNTYRTTQQEIKQMRRILRPIVFPHVGFSSSQIPFFHLNNDPFPHSSS